MTEQFWRACRRTRWQLHW